MSTRIAYIGAGNFTNSNMFPQLYRHGLELAAICDLDGAKARLACERHGFKKSYTDFRAMLDAEKPQAVFCVGGPRVHYEVGMEVLDRGFPLYIQKSPAPTAAKTAEMAKLAQKKQVVCHVGFNLRFSPAAWQAKAILQTAAFGHPLMGIFRYGLCFGNTMVDVVMDQHCHLVDLAGFLMGPFKDARALKSGIPNARDYVVSTEFASGAVGTLNFTSGQIVDKEFIYFEITGQGTLLYSHECGTLVWQRPVKDPWWKDTQPDQIFRHGVYGEQVMLETLGYVGDVANFIAAVKGTEADHSPISVAVGTMELCEKILHQIQPA